MQLGVQGLCKPVQGNFLEMPFEKSTFDGAYAIEATCHANKVRSLATNIALYHTRQQHSITLTCTEQVSCLSHHASCHSSLSYHVRRVCSHKITENYGWQGSVNETSGCVCMVQLEEVYGEVFRVLKPGGMFCSYEWVATKDFDPNDEEHVRIIDEINFGNGLPVRASASCAQARARAPACLAATNMSHTSLCDTQTCWRAIPKLSCLGAGDEDLQGGRAGREACGL